MASSLLALIDDIATLLDDVSVMTKVAAKKTAGVLGDDLALNAQQVSGVHADRELPVVWAVARGSMLNKAILVPAALAISALAPWAVTPLLMAGGLYLCFEGVEKLAHRWLPHDAADDGPPAALVAQSTEELLAMEKDKIKGAVRTDFILSGEIITITLGTVAGTSLGQQFAVLATVAVLMTVGVYGLVAGIVKLDDLGLWLTQARTALARGLGHGLLALAPRLMKLLSVLGTVAMFLVGGGILSHGIAPWHHAVQGLAEGASPVVAWLLTPLSDMLLGILAGAAALAVVMLVKRLGLFGGKAH